MGNKSYKQSLEWLYGGNYTNEQVQEFNKIFSLFGSQAFLEQENLLIVLNKLFRDDRVKCLDEEEVLHFIEMRIRNKKQ